MAFIVSVQGNIGSGKSAVLAELARDYRTFPEDLARWSPWLSLFYEEMSSGGRKPSKYALGLQIKVLCSFRRIAAEARRGGGGAGSVALVERSPASSRDIFVNLAAARGALAEHELELYREVYETIAWEPRVNIYLRCPPRVALERVRRRARKGEAAVDLEYIQKLHDRHEALYGSDPRCIVVDSSRPLAEVCAEIRRFLYAPSRESA